MIVKRITYILCTLMFLCSSTVYCLSNNGSEVILQGFHWEAHEHNWWNVISRNAEEIASSGINFVWLPPASASVAQEGYLPTELYNLDSEYGTQDQLVNSIKELKEHGVLAIADIVINHRCGTYNWADFTRPEWGPEAVCSDDEWAFAQGNADTGWGYHAGRDVDHANTDIRNSIKEWMLWLKHNIGYSGWRFDYVGGFSGEFIYDYIAESSPSFSVGEYWRNLDINNPDAHRQELCDWIDSTYGKCSAFDFTTKGLLQEAVSRSQYWRLKDDSEKPSGLIGWWPARSVTFLDNHDTGPSIGGEGGQNYWPFPEEHLMEGYAYILTHPGIPCIYWPHLMEWGSIGAEIAELANLRHKLQINCESKVDIARADNSCYAAFIDNNTAVKIGSGNWSPGISWNLEVSGKNYAVWSR